MLKKNFIVFLSALFMLFLSDAQSKNYSKPRVSIITSVFKGDDFIKGFLEDIVQESIFNECELILINADSPDNEEPIIKEYLKRYSNIKYLRLTADPGLYAVWNLAIKTASADLITNANIDDRRNHRSCEIQAQALEQDLSVDLVYGDYLLTYNPNETYENNTHRWVIQTPDFEPKLMRLCLPGPQPMWRKSLHEKYGYFDESFFSAGDWHMWLQAVSMGSQFKKIPEFISGLYYENPKGLSTDNDREKKARRESETQRIIYAYCYLWQE